MMYVLCKRVHLLDHDPDNDPDINSDCNPNSNSDNFPQCKRRIRIKNVKNRLMYIWLVVFYVRSTVRSFRDDTPHLLSLAKDVKLGKYTVPTRN